MTLWWQPCSGALETQFISCFGTDGPYYSDKSWASCSSVSHLEKSASRRIQNWDETDTAVVWGWHGITYNRRIPVCIGMEHIFVSWTMHFTFAVQVAHMLRVSGQLPLLCNTWSSSTTHLPVQRVFGNVFPDTTLCQCFHTALKH